MRARWMVLIVVASLALNVAVVGSYVFFQVRGRQMPPPQFRHLKPELRGQVERVMRGSAPEMERLMGEDDAVRSAMADELERPQIDERRLDSLARESGRVHAQMALLAYRNARRIVEMLPEDERGRFIRNMRHGMGRRMHRMMRGRGPSGPPGQDLPMPPPDDDAGE